MALGQVLAGNIIYADDIQDELDYRTPVVARKTGDTSKSNTTMAADPHLTVAFRADIGAYKLRAWLPMDGPTGGDFKCELRWTGTAEINASLDGFAMGVTSAEGDRRAVAHLADTFSPSPVFTVGTITANWTPPTLEGTLDATVDGELTLWWAQNAATGTTILKEGAYIELIPIVP